jgi:GT2 family glycosyltransferase
MVDLSVVIPTHRRRDTLPRVLEALGRQTLPPERFELIVVDDLAEDDAGVDAPVEPAPQSFEVRRLSSEGRGASAARNAGWRAARAELIMFTGDDILLSPQALEEHVASHRSEPDERVGVLGPVVWAGEIRVTPFMRWLEDGIQFDYRSLGGDEATWAHFYTANVSVKRSMLNRVGGFDEVHFPFLYEDLDVGYRMAAHGFRMIFNRRALGEHLHETRLEEWHSRIAATARAERMWVTLHPELSAYFHDRFTAAARGARGSRVAARAIGFVPRRLPVLGPRLWASADRYYCRKLAPSFLEAWEESAAPR